MTVTDVMVEAACVKYLDLMVEATGNEDETVAPEFMRAAIEAALAAQPVPTDAEIEGAIERYGDADVCYKECSDDINYGDGAWESSVAASRGNRDAARANLLRLIAAQRSAARRDDLESVRAKLGKLRETFPPTPDYDSSERMIYGCGYDAGLLDIKRHIDAELAKEAE